MAITKLAKMLKLRLLYINGFNGIIRRQHESTADKGHWKSWQIDNSTRKTIILYIDIGVDLRPVIPCTVLYSRAYLGRFLNINIKQYINISSVQLVAQIPFTH
jgi:hypothetical protein